MVCTPRTRGAPPRRMLKTPLISPTQPRRAETRRSAGKAAGESKPEEVPTALREAVRPHNGSWRTEKHLQYFRPPRISIGTLRISMSRERSWRAFSASCCCCVQQTRVSFPACDTCGRLSACSRGSASSKRIPFSSCRLAQRQAESDGCSISSHVLLLSQASCASDGPGPPWLASSMERWDWRWTLPPSRASWVGRARPAHCSSSVS